jgi:hypothetical protein
MATFDINAVARRAQYTSTGQSAFTFNFQVNETSELKVYVDDVVKTETTHYSASLNADGTGTVTFNSATTADEIITIIGDQPLSRTTVFQVGLANNPTTLETEFDNLLIRQQQLKEMMDRSIQLKPTTGRTVTGAEFSTTGPLYFPEPSASKVLSFNSAGTGLEATNSLTDITTLAGIASDISTVGGIAANVTTVAGIAANVTSVAGDATDIGAVAAKATEIGRLGTADAVADLALLGTSAVVTDLDLLATSGNVTAMGLLGVSGVITNMGLLGTSAVVTDLDLLGTSAVVTDMDLLGTSGNVTNMATLGASGVVANIATVAGQITPTNNIATVAGISSDITAVAGIASDIADVQDKLAEIETAADDLNEATSEIDTVAGAITNIDLVGNAIANVNLVGGQISPTNNIATVATNIDGVTSFAERYRVGSSNPASSLDEGDLFFNTSDNALKYYNGSSWASITAGIGSLADDTTPELGGDLGLNGNNIDFPTTANISDCLDEDTMSSDSATKLATQQSIKAYVDSKSHLSLIDEDNMSTDSATRPPSQQSVKAYVDGQTHLSLIDEDTMSTDSATRPPSQQSVKAYADTKATPADATSLAIALG